MKLSRKANQIMCKFLLTTTCTLLLTACQIVTLSPDKQPTDEPTLAVINGTVIIGDGSPPIEDGVVLVQGERVLTVGSAQTVGVPGDVPSASKLSPSRARGTARWCPPQRRRARPARLDRVGLRRSTGDVARRPFRLTVQADRSDCPSRSRGGQRFAPGSLRPADPRGEPARPLAAVTSDAPKPQPPTPKPP